MRFQHLRTVFVLATVLAVLMAGFNVAPVSAGVTRFVVTERFAFKLMNCLRTGGKITKAGKCRGYGSGKYASYRAPLKYSRKISNKVAWPWARKSAIANVCGHSLAGSTVDKRFRAAGLKAPNGESVGCGTSWKPRQMVITVLRWWQAEKAYRGWHWRQLRDKDFKSMGVGVAKLGNGRTRLVINFYAKTPA